MESTRLWLRNFIENDAESCFDNFGKDKNLGRFIPLFPMKDVKEMEQFVKNLIPNYNAWILIEKSTQQAVGYVTVDIPYPQLKIGEIGYVIGEKFQQIGYASEAVNVILYEYLLNRDLFMIEAKYNENNTASANLLGKMGFRQDGRLRDRRIDLVSGDRNDLIICSITKNEYIAYIMNKKIEYFKMIKDNELLKNLEKLHTTELGEVRIKRNLSLDTDNVVDWCKTKINSTNAVITRNGKNWYVNIDNCIITINAYSYTIITAHKEKK